MQFSFAKSCLLAVAAASSVLAQTDAFDVFTAPADARVTVPAGKVYKIEWTPSPKPLDGPITIILLQGKSEFLLDNGATIAKSIDASTGFFNWEVPTTTPKFDTYGFQLFLDSDIKTFQYSFPFKISGLGVSGSSSSSIVASGTTSGSASSSAPASSSSESATSTATATVSSSASVSVTPTASATVVSTTSVPASTLTPIYTSTNGTATVTSGPAGTGGSTKSSSSAVATQSGNAAASNFIAGTGLMGAVMAVMAMLL